MSAFFSAVLFAGGKSSRMGCDKAFLEIRRLPLWQRQLETLRQLGPHEIFIAGPAHAEWANACDAVIPDASNGVGPLGALIGSLRHCKTPLLAALAVDLPNMTTDYLRRLVDTCADGQGIVPKRGDRFEPLAAIYPIASVAIAEAQLHAGKCSLQEFTRQCVAQGLIRETPIFRHEESLFLNLNTPADLVTALGQE